MKKNTNNILIVPEVKIELNSNILDRQDLSKEEITKIKYLYLERTYIERIMEIASINKLHMYGKLWFDIEKKIQKELKFQNNDNFIKFWDLPRCNCYKEENDKKFPNGNYKKNKYCLVHS